MNRQQVWTFLTLSALGAVLGAVGLARLVDHVAPTSTSALLLLGGLWLVLVGVIIGTRTET